MRLTVILILLSMFLALTFDSSECQMTFGSNGVRLVPPINLATVFRLLKRTWNSLMYPKTSPSGKENKDNGGPNGAKGTPVAQNRVGLWSDETSTVEGDESVLSGAEKLILDELKIKINVECYDSKLDCEQMTLEEFSENSNVTISEEEENIIAKYRNQTGLEFPLSGFLNASSTGLTKEPKTPSFLPVPFSSGAWLLAYVALNSILLGLYIYLAGPYLLTGRTVRRIVEDGEEEDPTGGLDPSITDDDLEQMGEQYMGYTTYGDSDMIMSYMVPDHDDTEGGIINGGASNGFNSGANFNGLSGKSEGLENHNQKKRETDQNGDSTEEVDPQTKCIETLMCMKPVFGARALSASSLALKILEWIPEMEWVGRKFKANRNRFGRALQAGKQNSCEEYFCPTANIEPEAKSDYKPTVNPVT